MREAGHNAARAEAGWAIRFGQSQACDCAPWKDPRPRPSPIFAAPARARRRTICDLGGSLHCSIIGTCLTTDALRRLMRKVKQEEAGSSDHRLHSLAVGLCGSQGVAARLINKALDEQHRGAIRRFDAAAGAADLRRLWAEAMAAGDIPGAYWAALTHPAADQPLITDIFGDVHMLSHLVGASNRADIRRLAEQERDIAALRATVARQQQRLRDDITERDTRIRALEDMLVAAAAQQGAMPAAAGPDGLAAELQSRLAQLARRVETVEARRNELELRLAEERQRIAALEREAQSLRREVGIVETLLDEPAPDEAAGVPAETVLYVGGRSGQTALLRRAATMAGAELLHHDAEQGSALLAGLVGRASLVVFPVDCVSHDAALAVKRLCRQHGRPFRPLRSTGAASLAAALREFGAAAAAG